MDNSRHIIELTKSGWTLEHPRSCRLKPRKCGMAIFGIGLTLGERRLGRFYVDIDEYGALSIGDPLPIFHQP
ncbi:hypothetical protein LCGC14_1259950 [marine sediment metagenome]|uniref:Uncharacterized protein n=1 Tax=marine sediment metagenome TaxID=412755 RepID=A0A0F9NHP7_9ZZZZ